MVMCVWSSVALPADKQRFVLVIDAGHGGHDTGAIGAISKEKDINLKVALAFGKYVEKGSPDVKVIYTRKTDVFVSLINRANIANRNNADLFISIHTNALAKGKIARGFETYTLGMHRAKDNLDVAMRENSVISMEKGYQQTYAGFDPNSSESYIMFEFIQDKNMEKSVDLASMIQRSVCRVAGRADKGVHQAGFLVLRETSMPSCLIELGFITTPDEERALNNDSKVDDIARGIYQAFLDYKRKHSAGAIGGYDAGNVMTRDDSPKEEARQEDKQERSRSDEEAPVFKVQVMASDTKLKKGDSQFKGEKDWDCYQENGLYKYTFGESQDYNEIYRLRKKLLEKFPQAFIVAFKDGRRCDVNEAIREFKRNR